MASKILKGFAIGAGLGLAIGVATATRNLEGNSMNGNSGGTDLPDDILSLEPLLDRLESVESRISAVEARPVAESESGSLIELDLRVQQHSKDIEALQSQAIEHRQQVAGEVAAIERRFADITKGIPAMLESIVVPRVDDLRIHLRSEMQQSVNATLTKFERAIDDKVSDRIDALEKTLLDQSTIVTALSQRAIESEMNVQRLISAVERLCDRTDASAAAVPIESGFRNARMPLAQL